MAISRFQLFLIKKNRTPNVTRSQYFYGMQSDFVHPLIMPIAQCSPMKKGALTNS